MDKPFFSICIPNFNHSRFIGGTIQSVLDQEFENFEIIVVDNASTDSSWEIIQSFATKDGRILAFRNCYNVGFAPNLQRATEKAKGEYVILLSSDDLMHTQALAVYREKIAAFPGQDIVLHSAVDMIDEKGSLISVILRRYGNNSVKGEYFNADELNEDWVNDEVIVKNGAEVLKNAIKNSEGAASFCSTCYPRKLWEQVEGYDLQYIYSPDTAFLFKLLALNPKMIYVKNRLFKYRVHNFNQSAQNLAAGALKQQHDKYYQTFALEKHILESAGLSREVLINQFIDFYCIRESFVALRNSWLRSFKIFCYAWATYPKVMSEKLRGYVLLGLLLLGPVGRGMFNLVLHLKKNKTHAK